MSALVASASLWGALVAAALTAAGPRALSLRDCRYGLGSASETCPTKARGSPAVTGGVATT